MFLPKINAIVTKKAMNNFVHHLFTFKNTTPLNKGVKRLPPYFLCIIIS